MFHSDHGSIYGSQLFSQTEQAYSLTQSMSRRGNCETNTPMEYWFRSFKYEWMRKSDDLTLGQTINDVRDYVMYYNFGSSTSLQSRLAAYFNKNNLSGTVELVDHYILPKSLLAMPLNR